MIIHHPSAAGVYYPRDRETLQQTLRTLTRRTRTPKRTVIGAVAPHSGIVYAGETQAYVYKSVAGSPIFVLLGANHERHGRPYAIMTQGVWTTPLGRVSIDTQLAQTIKNKTRYLEEDVSAHTQEHSIETQLPWLQHLFRNVSFVPISIYGGEIEAHREIGSAIRDAAHETGRAICVVASSDLTHYGESFNFVPVDGGPGEVLAWMKETDGAIIDAITKMDVQKMLDAASKTNVCGLGAIATMLYASMEAATGGALLHYATSFPVSRSMNAITSFAALVME